MKKKDVSLFKNGVWIKEQQGLLTMGSLEDSDQKEMVLPDELSAKIFEFENDMIEALYGDKKVPFNPGKIDFNRLIRNLHKKFIRTDLRISFPEEGNPTFRGSYDDIQLLFEKLITASIENNPDEAPVIRVNASVIDEHLCIIYRDSASLFSPEQQEENSYFVKTVLNGEISYKVTKKNKAYYDIMIPSGI